MTQLTLPGGCPLQQGQEPFPAIVRGPGHAVVHVFPGRDIGVPVLEVCDMLQQDGRWLATLSDSPPLWASSRTAGCSGPTRHVRGSGPAPALFCTCVCVPYPSSRFTFLYVFFRLFL